MLYISGIHALNLPCELDTTGDWHAPSQDWDALDASTLDSKTTAFKDWGIETHRTIPFSSNPTQLYAIANHIRACLDLIEQGKFTVAQDMRNGYIDNEEYTPIVFDAVAKLRNAPHWNKIDAFMKKEYKLDWLKFRKNNGLA